MGGHGGSGIDHGVAQGAGMVALRGLDPHGLQAKRGFLGGRAFERAVDLAGVDGHFAAHFDLATAPDHAFEHDVVAVGVNAQGVADAHRLDQKAQFGREFLAHALDARHQLAACIGIDQGNQAVANFQAHQVHLVEVFPIEFLDGLGHGRRSSGQLFGRIAGSGLTAQHIKAQGGRARRQNDEHQVRHAGHQAQNGHDG